MKPPLPSASRPTSRLLERELLAEEQLPGGVARRRTRSTTPDDTDADDREHELAQRLAELVVVAAAGEARELREQRRLNGLEAEEGDARDQDADRELADAVGLGRRAQHDRREVGRVRDRLAQDRSEQQVHERARQLGVRRDRSGLEEVVLTAQDDERSAGSAAARARVRRGPANASPTATSAPVATMRTIPSAASIRAVRAEATVARERAAGDVHGEVRHEADDQRDEQQRVVVEDAGSMIGTDRRERCDDREQQRIPPSVAARLTRGAPPMPLRAAVRERAADLLLERLEEPGRERVHDDPQAEDGAVVDGRVRGR